MRLESYQTIVDGELQHSGQSYEELKEKFGTPLYIFDEESFKNRVRAYQEAFASEIFETEVIYASKALLTVTIARLIHELGLAQDVVSAGEIYTGLKGGVDPNKMYFHGNNKLDSELDYALEVGVGTIIVDNRMEAKRLDRIACTKGLKQKILLRLNPGIEAHTHDYIATAYNDSKFGESIHDEKILDIISQINELEGLDLVGFHCHIGSQVFQEDSFLKAATAMLEFAKAAEEKTGIIVKELNLGGGFGIYYTEEDQPFDVPAFLHQYAEHVAVEIKRLGLSIEKLDIEPGRSLVNESGSTLYTVGDLKKTLSGKNYIFVDGGMTDNIRPALYQAKYEAILTNKAAKEAEQTYTIAGKCCESGDKLIENYELPLAESGDLLLVNGTGAYNYTMANNYNRLPKPAMIHIDRDEVTVAVKRESFEDMIRHEQ